MSGETQAFTEKYLGPLAALPPSPAVRDSLRHWLLTDPLKQVLDAGAASSPMNVPGSAWTDAYAAWHAVVTATEMRNRWDAFLDFDVTQRGLPDGPLATPLSHVLKSTHYTVTQLWGIAALHDVPARRKLAAKIALKLRELIRQDSIFTKADWIGPSRAIGWVGDGNAIDYLATGDSGALAAAAMMVAKLKAGAGGDDAGHVWLWRNKAAVKDDRHVYDQCPWQDAPSLLLLARLYDLFPTKEFADLLLHALRVMLQAQLEDGLFVDDIGFDEAGAWGSKADDKATMDGWIYAGLHAIHRALGAAWPPWADVLMSRARDRFMATDRYLPGNSGFRDAHNQAIAIACAPLWGWRA